MQYKNLNMRAQLHDTKNASQEFESNLSSLNLPQASSGWDQLQALSKTKYHRLNLDPAHPPILKELDKYLVMAKCMQCKIIWHGNLHEVGPIQHVKLTSQPTKGLLS